MPIRWIRNRGGKDLDLSYQAYEVIQLAQQQGGCLSIADVVLATSLDDPTAERVLKDMIVRGYAEMQVTETGTLLYQFRDINVLALKVTEAITRHGITCRLTRCETVMLRSSDDCGTEQAWIECHLVMTSTHTKKICFSGRGMQLVDEQGGFYEAKDFMAGNNPGYCHSVIYMNFSPNIPVQVLLRFNPVNGMLTPSIRHIQLLTIRYHICRVPEWLGKDVFIQFQHIPLSEKVLVDTERNIEP